jgi:hypothetical protein
MDIIEIFDKELSSWLSDDVARQLETEVLDNYYRKLNRRF